LKIDEVKEFIGFLKTLFVTFTAIDTSLMAFLYKDGIERHFLIFLLVIILSVFIIVLVLKILKDIKKLKDL
jgi:phosphoglycerol transferase MdoB-like AlkP superfamily enzyme